MNKMILATTLAAFGLITGSAFAEGELAPGAPTGGEVINGTFYTWAQIGTLGAGTIAAGVVAGVLVNNASDGGSGTTSTSTSTSTATSTN